MSVKNLLNPGRHFVTANVCELPRHDKTIVSDLTQVRDQVLANHGGFVMWQELGNDVYRKALADVFPSHYEHLDPFQGTSLDSPISYDSRKWKLVDSGKEQFQAAHAKVEKGRYITWGRFQRVNHPKREIVVSSRHYVARAWNPDGTAKPRHDHLEAAEQPMRQAIWHAGHVIDLAFLREFAGLPQVAGGDYNRARISAYQSHLAGHRVQHVAHGIDWLHFIDGKTLKWALSGKPVLLHDHSDHAAVGQQASLHKA